MRDYTVLDVNHLFRVLTRRVPVDYNPAGNHLDGTLLVLDSNNDGKSFTYGTNLRVFLHWSDWSGCHARERKRTREGQCHVGKIDRRKRDFNTSEWRDIVDRGGGWLMGLHSLLTSHAQFSTQGLPIFSGAMAEILLLDQKTPMEGCLSADRSGSQLFAMVLDRLGNHSAVRYQSSGGSWREGYEVYETPCFYRNSSVVRQMGEWVPTGRTPILYGYRMHQVQKC